MVQHINKLIMHKKRKSNSKKKEKKIKERQERKKEEGEKQIPRTVENSCVKDTIDVEDEEVQLDIKNDELEAYNLTEQNPKVLITTSDNPHSRTIQLAREIKSFIPKAEFRFRNRSAIKKIIKGAIDKGYSDLILINENRREPNGLLLVHLPDGPTAKFRLSSVQLSDQIPRAKKPPKYNRPELILNNFSSRLGQTIGRMFSCLFAKCPKFQYRTVCTFHNQRDFIFFRYHRYEVDKKSEEVTLHECGPRMTLKLMSLQTGLFDPENGEYEWMLKRHEMQTSRKRFYL